MTEAGNNAHLRPIERTILKLNRSGYPEAEIAWRLRRSPGWVRRTIVLAELPRTSSPRKTAAWALRPIERRVLDCRESGVDDVEMAARLRRSPAAVQQIGQFADYKLARAERGASS